MNNMVLPIVPKNDLLVEVKTGDKKGAGTDCKIWFILHDDQGRVSSPLRLPHRIFKNTRNRISQFRLQSKMTDLKNIVLFEFWIEKFGIGTLWYVEYFKITNVFNGKTYAFPYHRWVKPNAEEHFFIALNDASLPQDTTHEVLRKQRADELRNKRQEYRYKQHIDEGPMQAAYLPEDEMFSEEYYWNFAKEKANLIMKANVTKWTTKKWRSFEELKKLTKKSLGEPDCMHHWDVDEWFGYQRVQGLNPFIIRLCKQIPENFNISENTVSGLLEDLSLEEAIEKNRIFICDLKILENIPCPDGRKIAVPLALFFVNNENKILPVAIQLFQQQGDENPVYTPKDPFNTWLLAKIFYNNAEAQHHQGVSHLGLTHLLMEGICICSHRQLSPSHPVFRLMAPHFLFLMAINTRGLEKLISPGGWVDSCMTQGVNGIYEVIRRGFQQHNFLLYGDVRKELESRGVLDKNILPYYPYRDDAVSLYQIIEKYVSKVVTRHYDCEEKLINDFELQEWRIELTKKKEFGGVGILGVPGDDVKGYSNLQDLIDTITIIISTCSLGHAATNFQQYDQYGFVPNYPGMLMRDPPQEKREYCDEELLEYLPNMQMTLSTMVITKLLSKRGTNSLGHFEVQYLYSEEDVQAADEFRKDLEKLSLDIKKRNVDREKKFFILDPEIVPNSISI